MAGPKGKERDFDYRAAGFVAGLVMCGIVGLLPLILFGWSFSQHYVVGPTPEELRETCTPVVEWIEQTHRETGRYPERLDPELESVLDSLPYRYQYIFTRRGKTPSRGLDLWLQNHPEGEDTYCVLSIGSSEGWPHPIYTYNWNTRDGWYWSCDAYLTDDEVRAVLEEHGYHD